VRIVAASLRYSGRCLLRLVSFRLTLGVSEPITASNLAHVLNAARIEQIGEMHYERALLPSNLNKRGLSDALDFDAGTTGKCGYASGTGRDRDDRDSKDVRAVHRVMRQHAAGHKRSRRGDPSRFNPAVRFDPLR
jgi:hypothetical protein